VEKLDAAQLNQLKEIGAHLQQVRQEQSRSLEEIATKTCIRLPLLQALEAGHGQILPEPVFVQGFIRRYADLLGLDGTSLARSFFVNRGMVVNSDLPAKTSAEPEYAAASMVPTFAEPKLAPSSQAFGQEGRSLFQSKAAYAVYAVLSVLVLGSIFHNFFKSDSPSPTATVPSSTASSLAAPPSVVPTSPASPVAIASPAPETSSLSSPALSDPSSSNSPLSSLSEEAANAPVSVAVRLTEAAWMQVLVDGQIDYEGTLPKGTERNWSAQRQITVFSGNAGAVSVSANHGVSKPMGSLGDVKELTVTAKS
jgi:cytoskeleton protein RodZ